MKAAQPSSATVSRPVRLERLEVLRYGKFTDLQLEFPERGTDFHLIVGANEAGKSTVRAAISDLLFGIETRTPYAFAHEYGELCLGGVLAHGERREHFQRLKRARNPLRDAGGRTLRDDLLLPFLGEMDRLAYERMFCLDHERLVRGGDEILTRRDDVAHLLFEASSGISGFGRLRDTLEKDAESLWSKRRSGDRAFYRASDQLQQADRDLAAATVRARDWADVEKRLQASVEALRTARRAHEALETRRATLERIRRVAPDLQKLRSAVARRTALGGVPRLARSAGKDVARAEAEIAAATVLASQAERAQRDAQERIAGITVERGCLERAAEIRALAEERARVAPLAGDIEKRRAELQVKLGDAARIAGELGWQGDELALQGMLPPQTACAAIQELLQEHGQLAEARSSTMQALAERKQELVALDAQLEALVVPATVPALHAALAQARTLGSHPQRVADCQERIAQEERRVQRTLEQLSPWQGSPEELRRLAPPPETEANEQREKEQRLTAQLDARRAECTRLATDIAAQGARAEHLRQARGLTTREMLEEARRERDAQWQRLRAGTLPLAAGSEAFEEAIETADRLADRRLADASDVARLEHIEETIAESRPRLAEHEQAAAEGAAQLAALRAAWAARMEALGLSGHGTLQFLEWSRQRTAALGCVESLEALRAERDGLAAAGSAAAAALAAGLAACGAAEGVASALEALAARADALIREAEARTARREALLAQRESARAVLAALEHRAAQAQAGLVRWGEEWRRQLATAGLPPDTKLLAARQALGRIASLGTLLAEARALREQRIETMQSGLEAFARRAGELAARLAPERAAESPDAIALGLATRLKEAELRAQRLEAAQQELGRARDDREHARQAQERAEASLKPLMEHAGASGIAELHECIGRSDELLALDDTITSARERCLDAGDGLALEALEAEVDAADLAALPTLLAQLDTERQRAVEERERLGQDVARDEAELRRYAGQADAALAEAARQEALAAMGDAVERYVKVFIAARLLSWCIDRYREEKQGPLLKRASEVFRILTRGSFERLVVDFEGKTPQLEGCRPGGRAVDVSGMSDGTRDQLYLALRLAALELQLDHGRALPFVADDLFINFDDERSAAGFQALAELATQTQVIFLTHHEHLVPIVERAIGPPLNVVRLA